MAKPLAYQPLTDFGVNGLNTQDNPATLDQSYLTSANNVCDCKNAVFCSSRSL